MTNLQHFISSKIRNIFLALAIVSIFVETGFGLYSLVESRRVARQQLFSEFKSVLKDPINQGSYIEAYARLYRYIGKDGIKCISLVVDQNVPMGKCPANIHPYEVYLDKNAFLNSINVVIKVWVDDSDLWNRQLWLFLTRISYYLLALIVLSYFLKRSILRVNEEIITVQKQFDEGFVNSGQEQLSIFELQSLSDTLKGLSLKIKESEKQRAVLEVAKKVSHDIRSPLSALNIISSRISKTLPQEGSLLQSASIQILKIAEDLLETNRRSFENTLAATKHILPTPLNDNFEIGSISTNALSQACYETFKLKEVEFKAREQIRMSFYTSELKNHEVKADSVQIQRIISNLMNNAKEAIAERGFISLNIEEENDSCVIELRDSGKGMSPELLSKIRLHPTTEGKEKGNGLGLHSAIKIIEGWSGTVDIRSALQQGTTIAIRLPLVSK